MSGDRSELSEVEIKIELPSIEEVSRIKNQLTQSGLSFASKNQLHEYYITKTPSALGGWDFERLRQVGENTYLRTIKKWDTDDEGHAIRLEQEQQIPKDDFIHRIDQGYELHYTKVREDFKGIVNGKSCTASIDTIEHEDAYYYYLECEFITTRSDAHTTREMLIIWMQTNLGIAEINEAPSMIDIITSIAKKS